MELKKHGRKWTARVRMPDGSYPRIGHELKPVARRMVLDAKAKAAAGVVVSPSAAATKIGTVWDTYAPHQDWSKGTRDRYESIWKNHVAPVWKHRAIGDPKKADVTRWKATLQAGRLSASSVGLCLTVLTNAFNMGIDAGMRDTNPAAKVKAPRRPTSPNRPFKPDEEAAILESMERQFPGAIDGVPFTMALFDSGGRFEDAAGIIKENIDEDLQQCEFTGAVNRDGVREEFLKTDGDEPSTRTRLVVFPTETIQAARSRLDKIGSKDLVYVGPGPKGWTGLSMFPLRYSNWRQRRWIPACRDARTCFGKLEDCDVRAPKRKTERSPKRAPFCQNEAHGVPGPWRIHQTRVTFATRVGKSRKLSIHDVASLLGHAKIDMAAQYVRAADDRFEHALAALAEAKAGGKAADASVLETLADALGLPAGAAADQITVALVAMLAGQQGGRKKRKKPKKS